MIESLDVCSFPQQKRGLTMEYRKKGLKIAAIVLLAAMLTGAYYGLHKTETPSAVPKAPTAADQKPNAQRATIDRWIADMDDMATRCNDDTARILVARLKAGAILGEPALSQGNPSIRVLEKRDMPRGTPWVALAVLDTSSDMGKVWSSVLRPNFVAEYSVQANAIVLRNADNYSPPMRALIALHEALHWKQRNTGEMLDPQSPDSEVVNAMGAACEGDAFMFETGLLEKYGGAKYQEVLRDLEPLEETGIKVSGKNVISLPGQPAYDSRLDEVLGPSCSEEEKLTRMCLVHINGIIRHFLKHDDHATAISHIIEAMSLIYSGRNIYWPG